MSFCPDFPVKRPYKFQLAGFFFWGKLAFLNEPRKKKTPTPTFHHTGLVGGFNPFEKYKSNWIISPGRGENKKHVKPPPSGCLVGILIIMVVYHPLETG